MGITAGSVFITKKIRLFLQCMVCGEEFVYPYFAALHTAAAIQCRIGFILRDKLLYFRQFSNVGEIFTAGKSDLCQFFDNTVWFVKVEPHETAVLPVGFCKSGSFRDDDFTDGIIPKHICNPFRTVWESSAPHGGIKIFVMDIVRKIMVEIPEVFRSRSQFPCTGFRGLYIGSKLSAVQKFADPLCRIFP